MFILKHFGNTEFQAYSEFCIQFDPDLSKLGHLKIIFRLRLAVGAGNGHMQCVLFQYFRFDSTEY